MARKRVFHGESGARQDVGADTAVDEGPSKSELKRQDRDLRDIGVVLVELPGAELEAMALPEKLYDAVIACRNITSHGARLRQEMYIAKVMRGVDVEPIRARLARRNELDRQRVRREHVLEQWRERLVLDEPAAWTELADLVDPTDLQQLRTLARQLFRRLRELLETPPV